jgi:formylglycine-generating enzyme required for sulfatase activity
MLVAAGVIALAQGSGNSAFEPEMVRIPRGTFVMGCSSDPERCNPRELPPHEVTVSSFEIGKYEVTVGQFRAFAESEGFDGTPCFLSLERSWDSPGFEQGEDHPVVCVSWQDAVEYTEWLTRKTGKRYRLPTEAEWEYAARGDATGRNRTRYPWGTEWRGDVWLRWKGNCDETQDGDCQDRWYTKRKNIDWRNTTPVGRFDANNFGLHDMHGNVWEWVADWAAPYGPAEQRDPVGPATGKTRVFRGGSWKSPSN